MSPDECVAHRTTIAFEVEIVLAGYWQMKLDPRLNAAVLADWADELEDWHVEQIRWALRHWRREHPRIRPNPGDILAILKEKRGRAEAARAQTRQAEAAPAGAATELDEDDLARRRAVSDTMAELMGRMRNRAAAGRGRT